MDSQKAFHELHKLSLPPVVYWDAVTNSYMLQVGSKRNPTTDDEAVSVNKKLDYFCNAWDLANKDRDIEIELLKIKNNQLFRQLNDLLNDCINFDGGKLTDATITESSELLKALRG